MCPHLVGLTDDLSRPDHYRLLTGSGVEWDACCAECEAAPARILLPICEDCGDDIGHDETSQLGYRGRPGFRDRLESLGASVAGTSLPALVAGALDLAPLPEAGAWLVLLPGAASQDPDLPLRLVAWDGAADTRLVAEFTVPRETGEPDASPQLRRLRLRVDAAGRFAVVGTDFGRHGAVLDLADGRTTMPLDGGGYRPDTVPFGAAFAEHEGRTVLVHRTAWNRVDVSDPATGALLTARETPEGGSAKDPQPPHYIDYFHGALAVSPDGRWVADNGWIWHPRGVPTLWSLTAWLAGGVWESEDGPTRRTFGQSWEWRTPMCWLDDRHVALGGYEGGYYDYLDGVRVVDAETGDESMSFPGPRGDRMFADGRRLYAAGEEDLEVWDFRTGERTAVVAGFSPTHFHPAGRVLARIDGGQLLTLDVGGV